MQDIIEQLATICDPPPPELVQHFKETPLQCPSLGINMLDLAASIKYSQALSDLDYGDAFGLVALEDANNSNPYCYVTRGPCSGLIFHLVHDGDPRFTYSSLAVFKQALKGAIENELWIDDIVPEAKFPNVDQSELQSLLSSATTDGTVVEVICSYIPVLISPPAELLAELAEIQDFYVGEAVAKYIIENPSIEYSSTAKKLAGDTHPQVSRPGHEAENAIRRIGFGS